MHALLQQMSGGGGGGGLASAASQYLDTFRCPLGHSKCTVTNREIMDIPESVKMSLPPFKCAVCDKLKHPKNGLGAYCPTLEMGICRTCVWGPNWKDDAGDTPRNALKEDGVEIIAHIESGYGGGSSDGRSRAHKKRGKKDVGGKRLGPRGFGLVHAFKYDTASGRVNARHHGTGSSNGTRHRSSSSSSSSSSSRFSGRSSGRSGRGGRGGRSGRSGRGRVDLTVSRRGDHSGRGGHAHVDLTDGSEAVKTATMIVAKITNIPWPVQPGSAMVVVCPYCPPEFFLTHHRDDVSPATRQQFIQFGQNTNANSQHALGVVHLLSNVLRDNIVGVDCADWLYQLQTVDLKEVVGLLKRLFSFLRSQHVGVGGPDMQINQSTSYANAFGMSGPPTVTTHATGYSALLPMVDHSVVKVAFVQKFWREGWASCARLRQSCQGACPEFVTLWISSDMEDAEARALQSQSGLR